jgi:hypothetical protein
MPSAKNALWHTNKPYQTISLSCLSAFETSCYIYPRRGGNGLVVGQLCGSDLSPDQLRILRGAPILSTAEAFIPERRTWRRKLFLCHLAKLCSGTTKRRTHTWRNFIVLHGIPRLSSTPRSEVGQLFCAFNTTGYFLMLTHQLNDLVQKGRSSKNLKENISCHRLATCCFRIDAVTTETSGTNVWNFVCR